MNISVEEMPRELERLLEENEELQQRINKAIKLLEEYLDREHVITDEYFEHIIQILKDDYEYVFVGSDKE